MLDHGFKTISRFYLNNFDDSFKQEVIDIILNTKETTIRRSSVFSDISQTHEFMIGLVSIMSCKNNETIEIDEKLLMKVFNNLSNCSFIFFVSFMDKQRNIKINSEFYQVYQNFYEALTTLKEFTSDFIPFTKLITKNFEVILFGRQEDKAKFKYYKDSKAKLSTFAKSLGIRTSYILKNYSIELFALDLNK